MRPETLAAGAIATVALLLAATSSVSSAEKVDFNKSVKPVLEAACVKCHGPKEAKGGYRIDGKDSAFKGGEHAQQGKKGIVPGKPEDSLLVVTIELAQKDGAKHLEPMPPRKEQRKLTADERALLRRWVAEGATWPEGVTLTPPPEDPNAPKGGRRRGGGRP